MPAIGFGQRVTGGDTATTPIQVTATGKSGTGTLSDAIRIANANSNSALGYPAQKIRINLPTGQPVQPNTDDLVITARNLTIEAVNGSVIDRNHLQFDCRGADNVILRNLHFTSDGLSDPRDTISIDATVGRHETGFWIDHCRFEAYFDLSITTNTRDIPGAPPLLITISNCYFHDSNPSGTERRNHGGIGIHGYGETGQLDQRTNAYATVCRNFFEQVRRRSPRSSHLTVVDAFNNVLLKWGSTNASNDQQNGMEGGHFGILLADANFFNANVLKETISLASSEMPPRVTVAAGGLLANVYVNGAVPTLSQGTPIDRASIYRDGLGPDHTLPSPEQMTDALRQQIKTSAGPTA